jgi:hypothetical protein
LRAEQLDAAGKLEFELRRRLEPRPQAQRLVMIEDLVESLAVEGAHRDPVDEVELRRVGSGGRHGVAEASNPQLERILGLREGLESRDPERVDHGLEPPNQSHVHTPDDRTIRDAVWR